MERFTIGNFTIPIIKLARNALLLIMITVILGSKNPKNRILIKGFLKDLP